MTVIDQTRSGTANSTTHGELHRVYVAEAGMGHLSCALSIDSAGSGQDTEL
jgi:hypothetical protein